MHYRQNLHCTIIIVLMCFSLQSYASSLTPAGWIEKAVVLHPDGITLHAKLDTGAETTSINAPAPEFFERNGESWVRFNITNREHDSAVIEEKIVRKAVIKRHFAEEQIRPVIMLDICVGNIRKRAEANLIDRSSLEYQLLIGRNFLKDAFLIDSGSTYRLTPDCSD